MSFICSYRNKRGAELHNIPWYRYRYIIDIHLPQGR
jgi:hypothetical protein